MNKAAGKGQPDRRIGVQPGQDSKNIFAWTGTLRQDKGDMPIVPGQVNRMG